MKSAPLSLRRSKLFRSATLGALVALGIFEVMHRVLRLDEEISGIILGVALVPAIVTGLLRQVATLLTEPDGHLGTLGFAFANILMSILFFAFIYMELGIYSSGDPQQREITSFFTCLYFSVSIMTTTGLGEFVPKPETRFIAAIEMTFGYFAFGIVTAATFFLLDYRGRKLGGRGHADHGTSGDSAELRGYEHEASVTKKYGDSIV